MKKIVMLLLLCWIFSANCQAPLNVKTYYLIITPIGISDVPRTTLFVSQVRLDSLVNMNFKHILTFKKAILTDEKTLRYAISFAQVYDSLRDSLTKKFSEFGCISVSVYNRKKSIINYDLDSSDSKKFLNSLKGKLSENNLDSKLVKAVSEEREEIGY